MDQRQMHSAGAIVVHHSPFSELEVPSNKELPPQDLKNRWVMPLYRNFLNPTAEDIVIRLWPEMTEQIAETLLAYFNWRPRIVGAYLVALRNMPGLTDLVGKLLLRSDLSDVGYGYCLALARLNTAGARKYLTDYLDYYLTKPELWFDQGAAMAAIAHLDATNGTRVSEGLMDKWLAFVSNKPNWSLPRSLALFSQRMERLSFLGSKSGA